MEDSNKKTFIKGAVILGVAGILVKVLGMFFRIPLTKIIGAYGMGYYQKAYPVYSFMLVISSAGLPTAISKMISERRAIGQYNEAYRVFRIAFRLMLTLGVVTALLMFFGAPKIAELQQLPEVVYALRSMAPALLLCPIMSCYRGFFQGQKNMAPTAVSQFFEQIFRVGLGLLLAWIFMSKGVPQAAAGASFGASAGAFFGLAVMLFLFYLNKSNLKRDIRKSGTEPIQSNKSIIRDILAIAVPITIGAAVLPIFNTLDTFIVTDRLLASGFSDEVATTLFGELSGMALPIINVPQTITEAICLSIVPVVSAAYKRDDMDFVRSNTNLGLRYAFNISLPCCAGMIILARPVMQLFYGSQGAESIANSAQCLQIYAVGLLFISSVHALNGVLQGIGRAGIPVRNLFIGSLVKVVVTYVLIGIPSINVRGAAIGTVVAYIIAAALNLLAVKKYTAVRLDISHIIIRPLVSAVVMGVIVFAAYRLLSGHIGNTVSTFISICAGVVVYAIMVLLTGSVSVSELESMPKMGRVARILRKLPFVR